jgi:hypothetical protein
VGKHYAGKLSTKFHCALAERLYGETPDEQLSPPTDAYVDWWGLYAPERVILHEDDAGFVYLTQYPSKEATLEAWLTLTKEFDAIHEMLEV